MINLNCSLDLHGLVEKEIYNIHKKVQFNFVLLLFYIKNYFLCCLYLYFNQDKINNISIEAVLILGCIIVVLSCKVILSYKKLRLSRIKKFSNISQITNFFNISFRNNIHVLSCVLFKLANSICVDKVQDDYIITFRRLNGLNLGIMIKFSVSDFKIVYKSSLKYDEIELRGTETVLYRSTSIDN